VVEVLDPIQPGLDASAFQERLQADIEGATARLIAEARSKFSPLEPVPQDS
jgi:hypothetical protein